MMGHVDNNAAIAHQIILRNEIQTLPKEVRIAWARFVVGLLIRSPAQVQNVYNRMITPGTAEYKDIQREFKRDHPGQRYEDVPLDVMKRGALLTTATLMQNPTVESILSKMQWSVYDLALPELRFFLSDRPVIMSNGVGKKGGHLVIPLSPRYLFMAFHDKAIKDGIEAMSPWEIHENVNKVIVRSAIDIV